MDRPPNYPSYEQRTFSLYQIKENPGIEYLRHPSGIIIMRLAADHECLTKEIKDISFEATNKRGGGKDLTKQVVTGKGKKGGLRLMQDTKLCLIKCADGSAYTLRSGIKATLIEANACLLEHPQLLKESRTYSGYLAVVIPPAIMNNQRNAIPSEFNAILRVGTEIPLSSKLFAPKTETDDDKQIDETEQEAVQDEEDKIDSKRQKLENEAA